MCENTPIKVLTQTEQINYCRKNDVSNKGTARNGEIDKAAMLVLAVLQTLSTASITPQFINAFRDCLTYFTGLGHMQTPLMHVVKMIETGFEKHNKTPRPINSL